MSQRQRLNETWVQVIPTEERESWEFQRSRCHSDHYSNHVRMWELDHKEGWGPENWCFQTVVLEEILESPLDSRKIKSANPKGKQPWIFIGRTNAEAEAEAPMLWPPDTKSWLIGKDPGAEKIEGRKRSGWQKMRWLNGLIDSMDMSLSKLWKMVKDREAWRAAAPGVPKSQTRLRDWTTAACHKEKGN